MVREAQPGDLSRIAEILVFGKRVAYRDIFCDDAGSFGALQVLPVAQEFRSDPGCFSRTLVWDDGVVKGMLLRGEPCGGECELCALYVDPFFLGCGIGTALFGAFLKQARRDGAQRIGLWVIEANGAARGFYERHGLRASGQSRRIPGTGVVELRYQREL